MRAVLALLAAVTAASAVAAEPQLPDLKLTYSVTWNGIGLGDATITLKPQGGDCYRYESKTSPIGLVRMFYGQPHETSEFCVVDGRIVPKRFSFVNPKDDGASFKLDFDVAAGKVTDGQGRVRDIPPNAQDRFGIQQAVRLWALAHQDAKETGASVEFAMVDDRRVKVMRFAVTGREKIKLPAGQFDTILVQRVDDPNKTSKFWIAPARDYMPVKVEQVRGGKSDLRMELR